MSYGARHVMESNQRLIRAITNAIYGKTDQAWYRAYSTMCKRQADLNKDTIMQFKYDGKVYHLQDEPPMRAGVKQLRPELLDEFKPLYEMFVIELQEEQRVLRNMLAHAIRIAKVTEDLLELLPEIMHAAIEDAGFFCMPHKPMMVEEQVEEFRRLYGDVGDVYNTRVLIGAVM